MKSKFQPKIVKILSMLVLAFAFSCSEKNSTPEASGSKEQLKFSDRVTGLLQDTNSINPLVDSLKKQVLNSGKDQQLIFLGELAENWRVHSLVLANEELTQSKKMNSLSFEGDALCKLGIYYCRKFNFDSCGYFLNAAEELAEKSGLDAIKAQSISWQAEALRQSGEVDKAVELQDKAILMSEKIKDKKRLAFCYISKGEAYRFKSDFNSSLDCYARSISYAKEINDLNKIAICYNSTGEVYRTQNNYPMALEYFNKGLEIAKKNKNKNQIAFCLSCMGDVYSAQKEYKQAIPMYTEACKIAKETGSKLQECNSLSSLGMAYYLGYDKKTALEYFNNALKIAEEISNKDRIAFISMMCGDIYSSQNNNDKAIEYYNRSVEMANETGNKNQLVTSYDHLSGFYLNAKKINEARLAAQKSFDLSHETKTPEGIKNSAKTLSNILEQQSNYKEALKMLQLFNIWRDTISNEENVRKFSAIEYAAKEEGLKAEQKAKEDVFKAEEARKEEELKRQKTIRYAFTIGFALVLVLAVVVFRNLQINKRKNKIITAQKKEVEHQKELVEEKNKEITDSITYAKRLQDAILPPLKMVRHYFPESFVYYNPKDIIAGDFYWMEHVGDITFFAAADSTGHGVPGAMVSVVCSNALNRAIKEFKLLEPGKILDKTRELVLETFEKSEGEVKDGMDISLLSIDHKKQNIQWSGANNPLWYISNNEVKEIKAHKQPIGKTDNPTPFVNHSIPYEKGSIFYLLTDGFADQFGGPKGKKFKYKPLIDILLSSSGKTMDEQHALLSQTFDEWKGHFDQVDDVTLIGVKL